MEKNKANEFTDEYFLNLTMDYDKRDDEIYPKWAVWCALSEDKYYIDGKDGHFYTHVRTEEEIAKERRDRELNEFLFSQRPEEESEEWFKYELYIREKTFSEDLNEEVLPFEVWKETLKEVEE